MIYGAVSLPFLIETFGIGELMAGERWFKGRNTIYHCL